LAGHHRAAVASFDRALLAVPEHADAFRRRGQSQYKLGRLTAAESDFSTYFECCRKQGTRPAIDAFVSRGLIHEQRGRPSDAADDYSQALALEPKSENPRTQARRARAHLAANKPHLSLIDYDQAIQHDGATDLRLGRALARARLGRIDDALADADHALKFGEGDWANLLAVARIHALAQSAWESGHWKTTPSAAQGCLTAALDLIARSLGQSGDRDVFIWRDHIRLDSSFNAVRQTTRFREWEAGYTVRLRDWVMRVSADPESSPSDLIEAARTLNHLADHPSAMWNDGAASRTGWKNQAIDLLKLVMEKQPREDRTTFWLESVESLADFATLREMEQYALLRQQFNRPSTSLKPVRAEP
jgi:hypothetical protein